MGIKISKTLKPQNIPELTFQGHLKELSIKVSKAAANILPIIKSYPGIYAGIVTFVAGSLAYGLMNGYLIGIGTTLSIIAVKYIRTYLNEQKIINQAVRKFGSIEIALVHAIRSNEISLNKILKRKTACKHSIVGTSEVKRRETRDRVRREHVMGHNYQGGRQG